VTVDLRLAVPAAVAWVSVGALIGAPQLLSGAAMVLWGAAILILPVTLAVRGRCRVVLVGLVVVLTATALLVSVAAVRAPERRPEVLLEAADAGRFVTATAVLTQTVQVIRNDSVRQVMFSATLEAVTFGARTLTVDTPVMVFADLPAATIGIGTTVTLAGTLSATDAADEVAFRLFAARGVRVESVAPWYLDWANGLRARFRDAAGALPGDGGDLLPGLAIGDTSAVGKPLDAAMKATSLVRL
jgi:competence protein ComEC